MALVTALTHVVSALATPRDPRPVVFLSSPSFSITAPSSLLFSVVDPSLVFFFLLNDDKHQQQRVGGDKQDNNSGVKDITPRKAAHEQLREACSHPPKKKTRL